MPSTETLRYDAIKDNLATFLRDANGPLFDSLRQFLEANITRMPTTSPYPPESEDERRLAYAKKLEAKLKKDANIMYLTASDLAIMFAVPLERLKQLSSQDTMTPWAPEQSVGAGLAYLNRSLVPCMNPICYFLIVTLTILFSPQVLGPAFCR